MADPILEFDPAAEATGTALTITTGNYGLTQFSAPSPPPKMQWAGSIDTEGQRLAAVGHENRVISISLEVTGASALATLQDKLAKIHREGGTLKYTSPAATVNTYDVLIQDGWTPVFDHLHYLGGVTSCTFSLTCKPYGRGAEQDLGDNTETTLPALVFTEASIPGDVAALGRLVIDEDDADNQWWLTWGIQSRYYSSSANAALFYEAEGRLDLISGAGFSSIAGASASSNIDFTNLLQTTYRALLSTASTGGTHLSHVGDFRVYVRSYSPTANTGAVTIALEWSEGDFLRSTRNAETTIPTSEEGQWRLVDLGIVSLKPVASGTQRWEGRIIAKSTVAGDSISFDYLMLVPVSEGSGIASAVARITAPTTYVGEDSFTGTTAGNALNGRTAPTGGTWATSGAATDITFADTNSPFNEYLSRTAAGTRYAVLGSTSYANLAVQALVAKESGLLSRWVDSSNHLKTQWQNVGATYNITKVIGGTETVLATSVGVHATPAYAVFTLAAFTNGTVMLVVTDYDTGVVIETLTATDPVLATGGTLATGKPGVIHENDNSVTMSVDQFYAWQPPADAALFASQSLEIRHDRVTREDSAGAVWAPVSSYRGDYLFVPPSGAEARTTRVIVKASRNEPGHGADGGIDDISARLFVTPRYLAPPA